ncbi:MAG: LysM peptidoglycan-binding domain-containing protein [Opitutales bacterium]|nr:LysM peptidoglycan-binding domain-containing protein [Opitutales bacterium]
MFKLTKKISAAALAAACSPLFAQSAGVADLAQDMELLKREVGRLRIEVEQFRNENETLKKELQRIKSSNASAESLNAATVAIRGETDAKTQALKKEIMQSVKKELDSLAAQTTANMERLAAAINARKQIESSAPQSFSNDYPQVNGYQHTVVSGDTLSAIAKKYGSKVKWIRDANKISDPNKGLIVGKVIWVPTE